MVLVSEYEGISIGGVKGISADEVNSDGQGMRVLVPGYEGISAGVRGY